MAEIKTPAVSVIVPNYNHARFLSQRLNSILQQTFRDFEVIILDDASTDNSVEIIEQFRARPEVKHVVINSTNSGSPFAQWKKGLDLATGHYIWIAESDDFASTDFLATAMQHFLSSPVNLFYCRSVIVDEQGHEKGDMSAWYGDITKDLSGNYEMTGDEELSEHLFFKNTIANASSAVFHRRTFGSLEQTLQEINGMRYCGDWLFWMKCCDSASGVAYSTKPVNYFRTHETVSRKTTDHSIRNREVNAVLRYVLRHDLSHGRRKNIIRYFQSNHVEIKSRRSWGWNITLAMRQIMISPLFIGWWIRYYLRGEIN